VGWWGPPERKSGKGGENAVISTLKQEKRIRLQAREKGLKQAWGALPAARKKENLIIYDA